MTDGESGLVADPTAEAIADAIDRMWELPAARLQEMGEAGRRRVEDINWDRIIDRLTEGLA